MESASLDRPNFLLSNLCRCIVWPSALFLGMTAALGGCATNLATGERHLNFTSESDEIAMGRQADAEISASLGLYPDDSLQRYVQQLGAKVAATSERPALPWTFRVVDDPAVNAFALPGGFIYVTRGILAYLGNEAELAGVLGHEIGHVTAQHSVHRMATQQLTQLGLGVGVALKPELERFADLAGTGLGVLFLKFSRDDESQADELGVRYMTRANNDPHQLSAVMTMLDGVSGGEDGRAPEWLATHPNPGNRREHIDEIIRGLGSSAARGTINRDAYLRRIDGITFGPNPREGFFRGTTFYQPDLKFQFAFPAGWQTRNQKQAVVGVSADQDAILVISLTDARSTDEAARAFFTQEGVAAQGLSSGNIHGYRSTSGIFAAQSDQGVVQGEATFVDYDGHVYQLLGYTGQDRWPKYERTLSTSIRSFDRLTDRRILSTQPRRVRLVKIDRTMSLEAFDRSYPSGLPLETLSLLNQVEPNGQLPAGQSVKRIDGEKFE